MFNHDSLSKGLERISVSDWLKIKGLFSRERMPLRTRNLFWGLPRRAIFVLRQIKLLEHRTHDMEHMISFLVNFPNYLISVVRVWTVPIWWYNYKAMWWKPNLPKVWIVNIKFPILIVHNFLWFFPWVWITSQPKLCLDSINKWSLFFWYPSSSHPTLKNCIRNILTAQHIKTNSILEGFFTHPLNKYVNCFQYFCLS